VEALDLGILNGLTALRLSVRSEPDRPFTDGVFDLGWNRGSPDSSVLEAIG
jgi:hypothetical protein